MIRFLSIENLAVVDTIELELGPGLTVLTGETGAGKSIVVGALALLVGARSTSDLVRSGESRAQVQSTVEDDDGNERILRREVSAQGRSRAFVDGALTTASALQDIGSRLVDLHGQHDHQTLLNPTTHLSLLDGFAGLDSETNTVAMRYRRWQSSRSRLQQARGSERERAQRVDVLSFQRDEIVAVEPSDDEDVVLEAKRLRLSNAERLMALGAEAYAGLYESDDAILGRLVDVWRQVDELTELDSAFASYAGVRESVTAQLEDLAFSLRSYRATIEASPIDLAVVEDRIAVLQHLKRKYGPSLQEVTQHLEAVNTELKMLIASDAEVGALADIESQAREDFLSLAAGLGQKRREAAKQLTDELQRVANALAMPDARFEVRFEESPLPEETWSEEGIDSAEFFFSANLGESLRPLARVASGGELSRVMLGLRTLASPDRAGKTLVFDEVDAGIGGAVADRVGAMMSGLSREYQVLCVTHLPQIAAYATTHYHVSKLTEAGRTVVRVEALTEEGRAAELARLMTGGISPTAMAGARELRMGKEKAKGESSIHKRKSARRSSENRG